jgi:hypothetical protein
MNMFSVSFQGSRVDDDDEDERSEDHEPLNTREGKKNASAMTNASP